MTPNDVHLAIAGGESETVEFKSTITDASALARLIAGFANAIGGTVLVGIKEPNEVVGTDVGRVNRVLEAALERLSPRPTVAFSAVEVNGRPVASLAVQRAGELVFADGGAFSRVGSMTVALSPSEITQRFREPRPEVSHALERIALALATQTALVQEQNERLQAQRQQLEVQQASIEAFSSRFTASQAPRGKVVEWLISGGIGAVLGQLVTLLFT